MSRFFGGTSLTIRSPMRMTPSVISSSPATMRSVVDLPAARRPDEDDELLIADRQIDRVHGLHVAGIDLGDFFEFNTCHAGSRGQIPRGMAV
jgi:hypothetical protein